MSKSRSNLLDLNESILRNSESLFSRFKSCLIVQAKYKEAFRNLRDALGGNQALSSFPSVSSVHISDNSISAREQSVMLKKNNSSMNMNRKGGNESTRHSGILMSEEDIIFGHLDLFCNRIKCVIDQITSLAQFQILYKTSSSLPRPKREDLRTAKDDRGYNDNSDSDEDDFEHEDNEDLTDNSEIIYKDTKNEARSSNRSLGILIEENEDNHGHHKPKETKKTDNKYEIEMNMSTSDLGSDDYYQQEEEKIEERPLSPNKRMIKATEKLFKTEQNVDIDSKNILRKAQTLSREDIKLMS